ncbi:Gag-Pol polyprotein [Chionoecetes opilio]|uniref:ribonuclease H n=1 Tax=Chionoecetes opilio TaxID=41210 RepID=A0A8J4XLK3_CHIOP|nr:Gag-Pol polyprotein [Chionoecetes opilio]
MKGLFLLLVVVVVVVVVKAQQVVFPGQPSGGGCDCQPIIACASDFELTTGRDSTTTMQESLNLLTDKCEEIGFTLSQTKTKAMAKTRNAPLDTLRLQGQNVEWVATQRYLGVIVARNNGCKAEIQHLKDKCRARNRILRAMSWKGMGASGTVILSAYKSLVRSLVDYASPVLLHITTTDAKSLETIQNEALRTILGVPKWTKTENMRAETQLHNHHEGHRGQGRWLKTAIETLQHSGVAWEAINTAVIPLERNATAPWEATLITTVVRPPRRKKRDCLPVELRQEGLQNIQGVREPYAAVYYTDGSTDPAEGRSGAAFVCKMGGEDPVATATRVHTASARTSDFSSSTQTELTAISMALDHAHSLNTLIVTDSMTAIACINKQDTENTHLTHAIRAAVKAIHNMGRSVTITWVASHVGITGNEEADALAKQATMNEAVTVVIPRTLRQLKGHCEARAEAQRRRVHEQEAGRGSTSARWYTDVAAGCLLPPQRPLSRLCEVITQDCTLGDGSDGVCCPADGGVNIGERMAMPVLLETLYTRMHQRPGAAAGVGSSMLGSNTRELFSEAAPSVGQTPWTWQPYPGLGGRGLSSLAALEQNQIQTNNFLDRGTPESNHLHHFRITPEARAMDKSAWAIVSASLSMAAEMSLSPREGGRGTPKRAVSDTALRDQCPRRLAAATQEADSAPPTGLQ